MSEFWLAKRYRDAAAVWLPRARAALRSRTERPVVVAADDRILRLIRSLQYMHYDLQVQQRVVAEFEASVLDYMGAHSVLTHNGVVLATKKDGKLSVTDVRR